MWWPQGIFKAAIFSSVKLYCSRQPHIRRLEMLRIVPLNEQQRVNGEPLTSLKCAVRHHQCQGHNHNIIYSPNYRHIVAGVDGVVDEQQPPAVEISTLSGRRSFFRHSDCNGFHWRHNKSSATYGLESKTKKIIDWNNSRHCPSTISPL